jgi:hypothetical protein
MYEEDENIFRDIEVRPNNSFAEFEDMVVNAWNLPSDGKGAFFMSNDRAQKIKAFDHRKPIKRGNASYMPLILNYVEDPHQKFLYEHLGKQELSFYIELLVIAYEKPGVDYPRVSKTSGPSPVKKEDVYKHIGATAVRNEAAEGLDEDDSQLLKGFGTEGDAVATGAADDDDALDLSDDEEEEAEADEEVEDGNFRGLEGGDKEDY